MEAILELYRQLLTHATVRRYLHEPALASAIFRGCRAEIVRRDDDNSLVIERIFFPPQTRLPPHRHPHVSVADYGVSGSGEYSVKHHKFSNDEARPAALPFYVPRNVLHGGVVGDIGATIVSFQYWHEWPPRASIFLDWEQ